MPTASKLGRQNLGENIYNDQKISKKKRKLPNRMYRLKASRKKMSWGP